MKKSMFEQRKETILAFMKDKNYKPMRARDMAMLLNVSGEDRPMLRAVLESLVKDGKIALNKRGHYRIAEPEVKTGLFRSTLRGFGFVTVEGMDKDVFIPEREIGEAFHMDQVEIKITKAASGTRGAEGSVTRVLEHTIKELTGVFIRSKNFGFVEPDNDKFGKDIYISKGNTKNIVNGQRVVVRILNYGSKYKNPEGEIIEVLGSVNDPTADMLAIVRSYQIPEVFPEEVLSQVQNIPDHVLESEYEGRRDFRELTTVTIDGEDAKDLDDAITLTKEGDIYHLGVHIADVSHYVTEGSALDKEALNRSTSVYLVNRVIPMLPPALSNGICSLNQGVDRLCMSCLMDINEKGEIISHTICEGVLRVDRRMSYHQVQDVLDEKEEALETFADFKDFFFLMKELSEILREKRRIRGSLDFDFPESKIILDETGHAIDIFPYERSQATDLIEDFMLAANETIAEDSFWQELPFLYRVHEEPDNEKIQALSQMIKSMGYGIKTSRGGSAIHAKELQKLLRKCQDTPEEAFVSRLALRSLKQARYATSCVGHFGLAAKYYCHFTSPIRRYPDLQIHRILKENLHGRLDDARLSHYHEILDGVAKQTSSLERRADDAERDTDKLKMAEYMSDHLGEVFEGMITSITDWGMFVELPNTVEGLISVDSMQDDFYQFDSFRMTMTGHMSGKQYKIGSVVKVTCIEADLRHRTIDFVLYEEQEEE